MGRNRVPLVYEETASGFIWEECFGGLTPLREMV